LLKQWGRSQTSLSFTSEAYIIE